MNTVKMYFANENFENVMFHSSEFQILILLFGMLALGSSFVHYRALAAAKVKIRKNNSN